MQVQGVGAHGVRPPGYRMGIDIGGTFTDGVLMSEATGEVSISKVSSTPSNPSVGFMEAVERLLAQQRIGPEAVSHLVHGTTVATNAIIEQTMARVGLLTTRGFRDILEIARQIRPDLYDLFRDKPTPLVPRYLCREASERLGPEGETIQPLSEDDVREAAHLFRREGVESVVVCFLHSYLNPGHERRAGDLLRELLPEVFITLSSDVCAEFREYFRASTAIVNAGVMPVVDRYLSEIERRMGDRGLAAQFYIMQSNGGVLSSRAAREKPVYIVESGPAAGVIAAATLGRLIGQQNVISLDMGGTTAKAGLIQGGRPHISNEYEVGSTAAARKIGTKATGYPIRTPVIDLVEIGAGGGSIAWIDSGGALRVGPRSAGADPGPVCYGRGGTEPTVTDANLLLGRINPGYFLGGEIGLDADRARAAVEERCAGPLGRDAVAVAEGILEIANAGMIEAIRLVSVQRGYDPRDFALVAFGGAGPLHASFLARELGIPTLVVPPSPGVASALGLLMTDLQHEYVVTRRMRVAELDLAVLAAAFGDFEEAAVRSLLEEGIGRERIVLQRFADVRYVGQSYELRIPVLAGEIGPPEVQRVVDAFHAEHERAYGYAAASEPTEIVNLRLTAIGQIPTPHLKELPAGGESPATALKGHRPVCFGGGDFIDCPVYDRYRLQAGNLIPGPAVVEEADSTTLVLPGFQAQVERYGSLVLSAAC